LSGELVFTTENSEIKLRSGDWLFLAGSQAHSLTAISDCVVLVTIFLPTSAKPPLNL
jgi:quercetin dioxygenase-like cupin family protein